MLYLIYLWQYIFFFYKIQFLSILVIFGRIVCIDLNATKENDQFIELSGWSEHFWFSYKKAFQSVLTMYII